MNDAKLESLLADIKRRHELKETRPTDSYTFDELRAFGCPDYLLMQYLGWTKEEVDRLLEAA